MTFTPFRLPDLYFANARNSKFHDVTAPNFNLFIDKNGNIAYSIRFGNFGLYLSCAIKDNIKRGLQLGFGKNFLYF